MKTPNYYGPLAWRLIFLSAALGLFLPLKLSAAITVNWGNALGDLLVDSENNPIFADETFTFQLGAFTDGASPYSTSVQDWSSNWAVFDETTLNEPFSNGEFIFSSTADLQADGTSSSAFATENYDFSGAELYLWVFNENDQIEEGTEWFLARIESWTLPDVTAEGGCDDCPTDPLEFPYSDLIGGGITPVFGGLEAQTGDGYFIDRNTGAQLQTFAVIPEPRFWGFLLGILALGIVWFRKRNSRI